MSESIKPRELRRQPIVAIDGPTGAGKSTVARELARELGFTYLNTGAMYRAVALAAGRAGIDPDAPNAEARMQALLDSIRLELDQDRVLLNGADVAAQLSDPVVSDRASRFSAIAIVRERMRELQQTAGGKGGIVMEGRDIGTVIFPDAEFKFFLSADLRTRARRRYKELIQKGVSTTFDEVYAQLEARDRRDQERALAPLRAADDAVVIDSTNDSVAEVVARLKRRVCAGCDAE
ncbi:MAG TPA: (d)CMP kinase [Candidatus Binataceae bacterium]|nr:(d)CMP kinase [Candidatus Binataceae bacterium]